jgi:uncharacterized protein (TIGR02391 family)
MAALDSFELIARSASLFTEEPIQAEQRTHPFIERNIHPKLPQKVLRLFDDTHYAEATFEAFKFLDRKISALTGLKKSGSKLMQEAFRDHAPAIQLTPLSTDSEVDEQRGFQWIFTGSVWAIRNPRGHEFNLVDDIDRCLDHLTFASMLMRRLEQAGYSL